MFFLFGGWGSQIPGPSLFFLDPWAAASRQVDAVLAAALAASGRGEGRQLQLGQVWGGTVG